MNARVLFTALLLTFTAIGVSAETPTTTVAVNRLEIKAPFEMPPIAIPDFSRCARFPITAFGAIPDDKAANSSALSHAIKAANAAGGGVVVVPAGEWQTAKIHLQSNVNLHLEEGAVLVFSENPADYLPAVKTTWEGFECYNYSPLVYAYDCVNVAITGPGKLHAKLDTWRKWYARPAAHLEALKRLYHMASKGVPVEERQMVGNEGNLRPHFVQFNRCQNVRIEDVSIENSPFWVLHPFLCRDVLIRGVKVKAHGHNNDGVDPEMSQNVLIEDCIFDQGDDAIVVKSGSNQDGWRLNTPSKNIVVRNCKVLNAHQLLAIGSELSGGVENVFMDNCHVDRSIKDVGHLLFIKTNERRGGYVKGIHMHNVSSGTLKFGVLGIETDVLYQWRNLVPTYEVRHTPIRDIAMRNVHAGEVKFVSRIQGLATLPVENVLLENVTVATATEGEYLNANVEGFAVVPNP